MSFVIRLACDDPGCDASVDVSSEAQPICAENIPAGLMFVLDTGWISVDGWKFVEGGERCPEHAP